LNPGFSTNITDNPRKNIKSLNILELWDQLGKRSIYLVCDDEFEFTFRQKHDLWDTRLCISSIIFFLVASAHATMFVFQLTHV
jgi:hypothetical protein